MRLKITFVLPLIALLAGCAFTTVLTEKDSISTNVNTTTTTTTLATWQQVKQDYEPICVNGETKTGPWNNNLALAQIDLAEATVVDEGILVEAGGVPTMVADAQGRLVAAFQWFSCDSAPEDFDKVAIITSDDGGETWSEPTAAVFTDIPNDYQRPFDPTLAVLPDGRIRMYFTSTVGESMMLQNATDIFSAISDDGIHYTYEPGVRFDLAGGPAYDAAVGFINGYWHMITPNNVDGNNGKAHHLRSLDGLTFELLEDIELTEAVNWTGNFLAQTDGLYFFGTPNQGKAWSTKTTDSETWSTPEYLGGIGGDPAVVCPTGQVSCLVISVAMGNNQPVQPVQPLQPKVN